MLVMRIVVYGEDNADSKTGYKYTAQATVKNQWVAEETSDVSYQEAIGKLILSMKEELTDIVIDEREFGE